LGSTSTPFLPRAGGAGQLDIAIEHRKRHEKVIVWITGLLANKRRQQLVEEGHKGLLAEITNLLHVDRKDVLIVTKPLFAPLCFAVLFFFPDEDEGSTPQKKIYCWNLKTYCWNLKEKARDHFIAFCLHKSKPLFTCTTQFTFIS
jgi:hypothetical protein